jgi:hypothetical protein
LHFINNIIMQWTMALLVVAVASYAAALLQPAVQHTVL